VPLRQHRSHSGRDHRHGDPSPAMVPWICPGGQAGRNTGEPWLRGLVVAGTRVNRPPSAGREQHQLLATGQRAVADRPM